MDIQKLIAIASKGYPECLIESYFHSPDKNHGDVLAAFIATELRETFDPDADDTEQLFTAMSQMEKAQAQINEIMVVLDVALAAVK